MSQDLFLLSRYCDLNSSHLGLLNSLFHSIQRAGTLSSARKLVLTVSGIKWVHSPDTTVFIALWPVSWKLSYILTIFFMLLHLLIGDRACHIDQIEVKGQLLGSSIHSFTVRVPGIELSTSSLVASTFTHGAILQAHDQFFKLFLTWDSSLVLVFHSALEHCFFIIYLGSV